MHLVSPDTLGFRPGEPSGSPGLPALSVDRVARHFGDTVAIREVSLDIAPGEIHALLGPNGAGKTTLLRIVSGMTAPSSGEVLFRSGDEDVSGGWEARHLVGVVPSGERSFYLRLSGLENLAFFARLAGLRRRDAVQRARHLIELVGLADAATRRVGLYSQGMRKRLSAARALLVDPPVLLVDEATHDLDPVGAKTVRDLVAEAAGRGAAVLWATQRLEELRGFAHGVTVMQSGEVRFQGSVDALIAAGGGGRHIVRLGPAPALDELRRIVGGTAAVDAVDTDHVLLTLAPAAVLGDALGRFAAADVPVLDCRRERPEIEEAFFALTQQVGS